MNPPPSEYRPTEDHPTYQQLKELLDETMAINDKFFNELAEYTQRLEAAGDKMDAYLKRQDGTTNGMLECRKEWHNARSRE